MVRHVRGEQITRVATLQALVAAAQAALHRFETVELRWIPRHRNGAADALARAALGLRPKPATRPVSRKKRR